MTKITGLINIGNTCFINSVLQVLFHCDDFINIFSNKIFNDDNLIKYQQTISNYFDEKITSLGPLILYKRYQEINTSYKGFSQEDAQEYLIFIIDDIIELFKKNNLKSEEDDIRNLFEIQLQTYLVCIQCGNSSNINYKENLLILEKNDNSNIQNSIQNLIKVETLKNDDMWFCEKCKEKVPSLKKMLINKTSKYLILSLNRYIFIDNQLKKNNQIFDINKEISIKDDNFILQSLILHIGDIENGHYMAIIFKNNKWILINDQDIIELNDDSFAKLIPYTYIAFYKKVI